MIQLIEKINSILEKEDLDAFLVTKQVNVEYLSGLLRGEAILLIIPSKKNLVITDSRFIQEVSSLKIFKPEITNQKMPAFLASKFRKFNLKRVGFESDGLTYGQYSLLKETCGGSTELIATKNIIEEMRMIKDEEEIEKINRAIDISINAFESLFVELKYGYSEKTIANRLEYLMREKGADCPAFETIVATGSNTSRPHAAPTSKKWKLKEPLLVDWGARLEGYDCDLTRMIFSYRINSAQKEIYGILLEAQEKAISAIRPGIEAKKIDNLIRNYLKKHSIDKFFLHSSGHGIGKEVHESPWISQQSESVLRENMVFTIEPAIYLKGRYGMRIEDIIRVNSYGCEILSYRLKKVYFKN